MPTMCFNLDARVTSHAGSRHNSGTDEPAINGIVSELAVLYIQWFRQFNQSQAVVVRPHP
jgi:hypothetical protein